jgi:hypothetical protein
MSLRLKIATAPTGMGRADSAVSAESGLLLLVTEVMGTLKRELVALACASRKHGPGLFHRDLVILSVDRHEHITGVYELSLNHVITTASSSSSTAARPTRGYS